MEIDIRTKRVYEPFDPHDGFRVLVDRLWPRGMTKEQVRADLWLKDVAPSSELRDWYHHDPQKWDEFCSRYFAELDKNQEAVKKLLAAASEKRLTLLFASRDIERNQAVVLKEYLLSIPRNKR